MHTNSSLLFPDKAIPIKCFVSHRLLSPKGGSVGRAKKGINTLRVLSASEGRAAKYGLCGPFIRNQMV